MVTPLKVQEVKTQGYTAVLLRCLRAFYTRAMCLVVESLHLSIDPISKRAYFFLNASSYIALLHVHLF
jgi:hypothetical protein